MGLGILREKKLKATPFRKEVLTLFLENEHALSVQDIENRLTDYDRTTLYRTIKSFIKKGVVHEIVMPGGVQKLALCGSVCAHDDGIHEHDHIHFQCRKCHETFCVEVETLPQIELPGFIIEEKEIQALGVCEKCTNVN